MRILKAVAFCCLGIVSLALLSQSSRAADGDSQIGSLSNLLERVTALENKVADLERKLDARPHIVWPGQGHIVPGLPIPPSDDRIPPGSIPRTFNGFRYYVVPLSLADDAK